MNLPQTIRTTMKNLTFFIIYAVLLLSTPEAKAQCTTSFQSQPQTDLSNKVMAALTKAGLAVDSAAASAYGEMCFNDQTQQIDKFTAISTDFDIRLTVNSLTDLGSLGQLTAKALTVLEQFPPAATPGPQAGKITLTYAVGEATSVLQTSVTQASQAVQQKLTGATLMQTLGYQTASAPTLIQLRPAELSLPMCANTAKSTVLVSQVTALASWEVQLGFDPKLVQVVDADAARAGVQVALAPDMSSGFVVQNQVDNSVGRITVAVALLEVSGDKPLFEITWQAKSAGTTPLTFLKTALVNTQQQVVEHLNQGGQIKLSGVCNQVSGQVLLQGREVHGDIIISDGLGQKTATDGQGYFTFYGGVTISAKYPGYLTAQTDIPANTTGTINVGRVTLLAGDVNGDEVINIFDLSAMSAKFNQEDTATDINGDGLVNIFDLSLAATNYGQRGPLKNWIK